MNDVRRIRDLQKNFVIRMDDLKKPFRIKIRVNHAGNSERDNENNEPHEAADPFGSDGQIWQDNQPHQQGGYQYREKDREVIIF